MAKIKYTYCKKCRRDMEGVAKFCDQCGKSDFLLVWEKDDGKDEGGLTKEQNEICRKLPESLRGLYRRQLDPNEFGARLEWIDLIYNGDSRIRPLGIDRVVCVRMYKKLYEEANCGEAAYMLGKCYRTGIPRESPFESDVVRSTDVAYEWFLKASAAGYHQAGVELGKLVEENYKASVYGDGRYIVASKKIPADMNMAAYFYKSAQKHGVKEGAENYARLAAMGYKGIG